MQTAHTGEERRKERREGRAPQSEEAEEKKRKRAFGLPAGLVAHFAARGVSREQLAAMSLDEILAQTGRLEGRALNKTVQTVLKTARTPEQLSARLAALAGRAAEEDPLESILGSVLRAHRLAPRREEGADSLVRLAYALATEAEHKNVKSAARFVLARAPAESAEALVAEKLDTLLPETCARGEEEQMAQHIALCGGAQKSRARLRAHVGARAEAVALLVQKSAGPVRAWKQVLGLYRKVEKGARPEDKLRRLGLAVLRTLRGEEALVEACSQYVQSMRARAHDFGYAQFFVEALGALPQSAETEHALGKLIVYALTERSAREGSLRSMGAHRLPADRLLRILEKVRAEKINLASSAPVVKQIARRMQQAGEDTEALESWVAGLLRARRHQGLAGLLAHMREQRGAAGAQELG